MTFLNLVSACLSMPLNKSSEICMLTKKKGAYHHISLSLLSESKLRDEVLPFLWVDYAHLN